MQPTNRPVLQCLVEALPQLAGASTRDHLCRLLAEYPELMSEEAEAILQQMAHGENLEQAEAQSLLHFRDLLHLCRKKGIQQALNELLPREDAGISFPQLIQDHPIIHELLVRFLAAPALGELRGFLEGHPELLTQQTDHLLSQIAMPNDELRVSLLGVRSLVQRCRSIGIENALAEWDQDEAERKTVSDSDLEKKILAIYKELSLTQSERGDSHRIQLCRRGIGLVQREEMPAIWAYLKVELARNLAQYREGNAEDLEEAIGHYQDVLGFESRSADPALWAATMTSLGKAYLWRIQGNRSRNLERAIECFHKALEVRTRDAMPLEWADSMANLGSALSERISGKRSENLEEAIRTYRQVLEVWNRKDNPADWALTTMNLANCYIQRIHGNHSENLEEAIRSYRLALEVQTRDSMPEQWALTMRNLGRAYVDRPDGHHGQNVEKAIQHFLQALAVHRKETLPQEWALTLTELGNAYIHRVRGERGESLERAIKTLQQALEVRTRQNMPLEWAETSTDLGNAFLERHQGDRAENIERAIECLAGALEVLAKDAGPAKRAAAMHCLGNAYANRILGDRSDNLERALGTFQQALTIRNRQEYPLDWAVTMSNLSNVYTDRIQGERADNLEKGLQAVQGALEVLKREEHPLQWAGAMMNMGSAYSARVCGDRAENIEKGLEAYRLSLQIRSKEIVPLEWARTMMDSGIACMERLRGDRAENLEEAISYLEATLEVFTPDAAPFDWARTTMNLGNAYAQRIRGDRSGNLEKAITAYEKSLQVRMRKAMPESWARSALNLGNTYFKRLSGDHQRNLEKALSWLKQALEVFQKQSEPKTWSRIMTNLGIVFSYRSEGGAEQNLEKAIECLTFALEVLSLEKDPCQWADTMTALGNAYWKRVSGDPSANLQQSIDCHQQALRVRRREVMPVEWSESMINMALAYEKLPSGVRQDNLAKAIQALDQSLMILSPETLPVRSRTASRNLGRICMKEDLWEKAAKAHRIALKGSEYLYQASVMLTSRSAELASASGLNRDAAFSLARAGFLEESALALEQGRARALGEALARDRADLEQAKKKSPQAYRAYREAALQQRRLEADEREEVLQTEGERPRLGMENLRQAAHQARQQLERAIDQIRSLPGYEGFLREPNLRDLARAVLPGQPLVFLITTSKGSLAMIVRCPDMPSAREAAVEPIWLDGFQESDLESLLLQPNGTAEGYLAAQLFNAASLGSVLDRTLRSVGERLIGPVAARLRELKSCGVVLIPGGRLALLPLHAARYPVQGHEFCLLDEFDVSYAPSARVLATARQACRDRQTPGRRLVGIGNPLSHSQPPLPYAQAELESLAAIFDDSISLYQEEASKQALLSSLPGSGYVHFACHGIFDPLEPLNSHLQLAREETLTLREILDHQHLQGTRLVVLSACQTALSEFRQLPDEALGLPAGFVQAGASGVVATLWPVDDHSTALLMVKFYEFHLKGNRLSREGPMPPARALRQAQNWLREATTEQLSDVIQSHPLLARSCSEAHPSRVLVPPRGSILISLEKDQSRPFKNPHFWAPFLLVGT